MTNPCTIANKQLPQAPPSSSDLKPDKHTSSHKVNIKPMSDPDVEAIINQLYTEQSRDDSTRSFQTISVTTEALPYDAELHHDVNDDIQQCPTTHADAVTISSLSIQELNTFMDIIQQDKPLTSVSATDVQQHINNHWVLQAEINPAIHLVHKNGNDQQMDSGANTCVTNDR